MYYDFHVHSDFSSDSQAPMEAMIQEGIRLGLPGICFTEHMDLDFPGEKPVFLVDLPAYKKTFLNLKEKDSAFLWSGIGTSASPCKRTATACSIRFL